MSTCQTAKIISAVNRSFKRVKTWCLGLLVHWPISTEGVFFIKRVAKSVAWNHAKTTINRFALEIVARTLQALIGTMLRLRVNNIIIWQRYFLFPLTMSPFLTGVVGVFVWSASRLLLLRFGLKMRFLKKESNIKLHNFRLKSFSCITSECFPEKRGKNPFRTDKNYLYHCWSSGKNVFWGFPVCLYVPCSTICEHVSLVAVLCRCFWSWKLSMTANNISGKDEYRHS